MACMERKELEEQEMKKSEANKIAHATLAEWAERNKDPGVLPAIPVILINSLCGDKPGISLNLVKQIPLADIALILRAALEQVEAKIKELEAN